MVVYRLDRNIIKDFHWLWKRRLRSRKELEEVCDVTSDVVSVLFSTSTDSWLWMADPSRLFTVNSMRRLMTAKLEVNNTMHNYK